MEARFLSSLFMNGIAALPVTCICLETYHWYLKNVSPFVSLHGKSENFHLRYFLRKKSLISNVHYLNIPLACSHANLCNFDHFLTLAIPLPCTPSTLPMPSQSFLELLTDFMGLASKSQLKTSNFKPMFRFILQ